MKRTDKVELVLIGAATMLAGLAAFLNWMPEELNLGEIALIASGLLLAQGLVRDLYMKYGANAKKQCAIPSGKSGACMCMESSLGVIGIAAGIIALFYGATQHLSPPPWFWPLTVLIVGLAGFGMKSLVIDWKNRRIRHVPDHSSIRFGK